MRYPRRHTREGAVIEGIVTSIVVSLKQSLGEGEEAGTLERISKLIMN